MTKIYKVIIAALFFACTSLFASQANARVCFATDPDCGSGGNFGNMDNMEQLDNACFENGYTQTSCEPFQLEYRCPYKSTLKMCCAPDYIYSSCAYPLVPVGVCGGKFKCQCDPEKFPYTEDKCHSDYKFSNPGGTACAQIDATETTTTKTLYYSACLCERGLYPYSKQDCEETANADVNGDPCVDSQGNSYWDSCKCSNPPYKWESIDCEFGGKGKACVQGGVYFFKECCSCAAFPAEGERGSRPYDSHATKWDVCDCPRKGRFKITQCSEGWQPKADGSACERISCENAVKLYFKKHPGTNYAVFNGSKLVDYAALTPAEIEKLPLEQQTYAVGAEVENTKATYGVLAKDVNVTSSYCSTGTGGSSGVHMGCTKAYNIYSGAYFGMLGSTADHLMVREACGSEEPEKTVVQTINFSGSTFPNTNSNSYAINIYGARLKFSGTTSVNRSLYLTNTDVSGSGATFAQAVTLTASVSMPHGRYPVFDMSSSTFKNKLTASGYDFNLGTYGSMYISVPASYKNSQIASITLNEGQEFRGGSLYVYPETDAKTTDYNTTILFTGPNSTNSANVYTDVNLAYDKYSATKRAHNMKLSLSGNLIWNMFEGSKNYYIGLSTGSIISSSNYGTGNYAKIKTSSSASWKQCYVVSEQVRVRDKHYVGFLSCSHHTYFDRYDSNVFFACKKTVTSVTLAVSSSQSVINTTGDSERDSSACHYPEKGVNSLQSSCTVFSKSKDTGTTNTQQLIYCE